MILLTEKNKSTEYDTINADDYKNASRRYAAAECLKDRHCQASEISLYFASSAKRIRGHTEGKTNYARGGTLPCLSIKCSRRKTPISTKTSFRQSYRDILCNGVLEPSSQPFEHLLLLFFFFSFPAPSYCFYIGGSSIYHVLTHRFPNLSIPLLLVVISGKETSSSSARFLFLLAFRHEKSGISVFYVNVSHV